MNLIDIEILRQLISRTDMSGNDKVKWLIDFIDDICVEQKGKIYNEEDMKQFGLYIGDNFEKLKGRTIDEIFNQYK